MRQGVLPTPLYAIIKTFDSIRPVARSGKRELLRAAGISMELQAFQADASDKSNV